MSRKGRGRLSSIDLLPEEAQPEIIWAMDELRKRERLQKDILAEFNGMLADKGIGPISASAFNRHSINLAASARRLEETREITAVLTQKLQPGDTDNLTIMVAEFIKTLVFEMLNAKDEAGYSPKQAMEMARAIHAATSAQNISADRRRKLEAETESKVVEAIDTVAEATGLSKDRAKEIRNKVLGVRE